MRLRPAVTGRTGFNHWTVNRQEFEHSDPGGEAHRGLDKRASTSRATACIADIPDVAHSLRLQAHHTHPVGPG
jgi:hypothetical protein